jgi:hypothetical protein
LCIHVNTIRWSKELWQKRASEFLSYFSKQTVPKNPYEYEGRKCTSFLKSDTVWMYTTVTVFLFPKSRTTKKNSLNRNKRVKFLLCLKITPEMLIEMWRISLTRGRSR